MLANGGWAVAPVVIERITDAQGKSLFTAEPAVRASASSTAPVVPARNVFITNSLLNDVTRYGTAAKAQQQLGRPDLYGKTGTTNDAVGRLVCRLPAAPGGGGCGVGHDQPQSLGVRETGGGLALPIWIQYMAQALKGVPVAPAPEPPEGVVRVGGDWRYTEHAEGGRRGRGGGGGGGRGGLLARRRRRRAGRRSRLGGGRVAGQPAASGGRGPGLGAALNTGPALHRPGLQRSRCTGRPHATVADRAAQPADNPATMPHGTIRARHDLQAGQA